MMLIKIFLCAVPVLLGKQFSPIVEKLSVEKDKEEKLSIYREDEKGKQTFWHSSAHLMAEAIQKIYKGN